jgi:hypothetical protein
MNPLWNADQLEQLKRAYAQRQAMQQQQAAQQQAQAQAGKHTSGRGGFLTSLISEGGATGGAVSGAMAGSVFGPVGTIIGGALGGFAGGFGGSALEQHIRDNNIDFGKATTEGAFSAIPGGTGKVVKTVGKSVIENGFKGGVKDELANLFTKQPGRFSNFATNAAQDTRGAVRGVVTNAPMQGRASQRVTDTEAQQINDFLNQQGLKGSRNNQQAMLEKIQQGAGQDINDIVHGAPKAVAPEDLATAQNNILGRIMAPNGKGVVGFNPAQHGDIANQFASQMAGIKDSAGWLNFKRGLDEVINYSRTNQGVDPMVERVAKQFRTEARQQLEKLHPDVVPSNQIYSQAQDALNVMARAKNDGGIKLGSGFIDFGGNGMGTNAVQAGKDMAARRLQGASGTRPITDQFGRQMLASGLENVTHPNENSNQFASDPSALGLDGSADGSLPSSPDQMFGMQAGDMSGGDATQASNPTGLQYSSTDLMNMALQAMQAGDSASYKQLSAAATQVAALEKQAGASGSGKGSGMNVSKVTAQQYGLAQTGMQSLQQLAQMIQSDPSVVTKTATPGRKLPVVGGFITNAAGTGQYDAAGYNIADTLLRLRTGATANESEVRNLQTQIMPRAGDSPATIRAKMQQLQQAFGNVLQLAQQGGGSSGGNDFEQQLMAMMGGGGSGGQMQSAYGY